MSSKTNWLETYGKKEDIKKFQEGGPMAAPAQGDATAAPAAPEAPAQGGGGELESMLAEYAQSRDPQLAVAICDMLVEMMAQGGAQGGTPEGGAVAAAKKGMKFKKGPVFKGSCKKK